MARVVVASGLVREARSKMVSRVQSPAGKGPPYPIVLVHGMAGFRNIGPIQYFYGIPEALRKDGHDVWVSRQDPVNDSEVRGAQALAYAQMVLASTRSARVNLIGHSQ